MREEHRGDYPVVGKIDKRDDDLWTVGYDYVLQDCSDTGVRHVALDDCSGINTLEADAENTAYILLTLD
jgi:hypothetical protein